MDKLGKRTFGIIWCGVFHSMFVVFVGPGEETANPSQEDELHMVGFGKNVAINLISWVSTALSFMLSDDI